jgi:hypothetical protein
MKTINKSLAKLDHISQMNWSKKDYDVDAVSIGNSVFNRIQTSVDPKIFKDSKAEHSIVDTANPTVSLASKLIKTGANINHNYSVAD